MLFELLVFEHEALKLIILFIKPCLHFLLLDKHVCLLILSFLRKFNCCLLMSQDLLLLFFDYLVFFLELTDCLL